MPPCPPRWTATRSDRSPAAAGTLPIVSAVSTSGSGSKVIRQGSKCTRVYENRVAAINPTDDRLKNAPAMVGNCFSK